jgi:hypothetical protein
MPELVQFANLDDNESMFFQRELEFVKAKTYDIKFPKLKATMLIPVSTEAGPGAESIVYQQYEDVGIAQIIASYGDDLPRADVKGREFSAIIKTAGNSYGWNIQEVQAAAMAGKPLNARKAVAARRGFDTLVDNIGAFGDTANNLRGLLTNPNIPASLAPAGAGGKTYWVGASNKTPDEILADMFSMELDIVDLTSEVEAPDTLVMPVREYGHIATTPRSNVSDTTILEFFRANATFIKNVIPWNKLADVSPALVGGGDTTNVMIAYAKDPDIVTFELPVPFTQLPAQERGLEFIVPCYGRVGGVIIYRPLAMKILEGI